jgi:hypothetical protein
MPRDILRTNDLRDLLHVAREALHSAELHGESEVSHDDVRRAKWQCNLLIFRMQYLLGPDPASLFLPYDRLDHGDDRQPRSRLLVGLAWQDAVRTLTHIVWFLDKHFQADAPIFLSSRTGDQSQLLGGTIGTHHDCASSSSSSRT